MENRLYKYDNIKAILIFLVVFGHFLERVVGCNLLYLTIYSFHMPLFMFVSGYFARFDREKIFLKMIYPYILFQILYTYYEIYVLHNTQIALTFTRPVWLLWYLFALIVYHLLLELFDVRQKQIRKFMMVIVVIVALMSGYDTVMGYDFSASRIITFMPFFLAGFYWRKEEKNVGMQKNYWWIVICSVILSVCTAFILEKCNITGEMLYGSLSYKYGNYNAVLKLLIMVIAAAWIGMFVILMPNKRVPFLTEIGRYTMPVFLLHGFVVKQVNEISPAGAVGFSLVLVVLLGNRYANKIFEMIFTGRWMAKLFHQ